MNNTKNKMPHLQKISDTLELLDNSSRQLLGVMENQIQAIIASKSEELEALSDLHATISKSYKTYEDEFINQLVEILAPIKENGNRRFRLLDLKEIFPEQSEKISEWHSLLSKNTNNLQEKHRQVIALLEFAMAQNARTMHSIYSMHNEKNMHYGANGNPSGVISGMAVNQEV